MISLFLVHLSGNGKNTGIQNFVEFGLGSINDGQTYLTFQDLI